MNYSSIVVQTLSGESLQCQACTVNDVMEQVEGQWHIPKLCQKLLCDAGLMQKETSLTQYMAAGTTLHATLIISLDETEKNLEGGDGIEAYRKQLDAILSLSDISIKRNDAPRAFPLLFSCVLHGGFGVSSVAKQALLKMMENNCEACIAATLAKLDSFAGIVSSADLHAVCFAIELLGDNVSRGDEESVRLICGVYSEVCGKFRKHRRYDDCFHKFQQAAFPALAKLAIAGDRVVITLLKEAIPVHARKADDSRLDCILPALAQVSNKGDSENLDIMIHWLRQRPVQALRGIAHVANRGHESAINVMKQACSHAEHEPRAAAFEGLGKVVELMDEGVVSLLAAGLQDLHWQVRLSALRSVALLMDESNEFPEPLLYALRPCGQDKVLNVRRQALEILPKADIYVNRPCAATSKEFVLLETVQGQRLIIEQARDDLTRWTANPRVVARRCAGARVKRTADIAERKVTMAEVVRLAGQIQSEHRSSNYRNASSIYKLVAENEVT